MASFRELCIPRMTLECLQPHQRPPHQRPSHRDNFVAAVVVAVVATVEVAVEVVVAVVMVCFAMDVFTEIAGA